MKNDIVIRCEVYCAEVGCDAHYTGRVVFEARLPSLLTAISGGGTVDLKGYPKEDLPEGWGVSKSHPSGLMEALYCPKHVVVDGNPDNPRPSP